MAFRRRELEPPRIELTPMIDVVFLLLIFFMISTTFVEDSGLTIDLPESTAQQINHDRKEIEIYLDKQGEIYFHRQKLSLQQLVQRLNAFGPEAGKMTFLLMADKDAKHGRVIEMMDAAKSAGFATLAIATDRPVD